MHRHPTATFHSPLLRMWELMTTGALLAWYGLHRAPHRTALHRELRNVVGLGLIGLGLALIMRSKSFPGGWVALLALGACYCTSAGPGAWLNRHVPGARPMVCIGLISYPLYLWHWPLLAFARVVEGAEPWLEVRIAAVVAVFVLVWATYRFAERKPRHRDGAQVAKCLMTGMVAVALIGATLFARIVHPRNNDPTLQAIVSASADWAFPDGLHEVTVKGQNIYRIGFGKEGVPLLGDGHVEQFVPRAVEFNDSDPEGLPIYKDGADLRARHTRVAATFLDPVITEPR